MVADQAHVLFGIELPSVEGDDAGRFLAAMLPRVQPERRQRCGFRMPENAEHAAFFVELVVMATIDDMGGAGLLHGEGLCSGDRCGCCALNSQAAGLSRPGGVCRFFVTRRKAPRGSVCRCRRLFGRRLVCGGRVTGFGVFATEDPFADLRLDILR